MAATRSAQRFGCTVVTADLTWKALGERDTLLAFDQELQAVRGETDDSEFYRLAINVRADRFGDENGSVARLPQEAGFLGVRQPRHDPRALARVVADAKHAALDIRGDGARDLPCLASPAVDSACIPKWSVAQHS